jgi:hypothetical protein
MTPENDDKPQAALRQTEFQALLQEKMSAAKQITH